MKFDSLAEAIERAKKIKLANPRVDIDVRRYNDGMTYHVVWCSDGTGANRDGRVCRAT
jgi:hypothetical protein